MIAQIVLLGAAILLLEGCSAEYDVNKYCKLIQPETKLPSFESSHIYYNCLGNGTAVESSCYGTDVFDKDAQSCIAASDINPAYLAASNPCQTLDKEFAYSARGCNWYNYCIDGQIAGSGTCPLGEIYYPANGTCGYGHCDDSVGTGFVDMCAIMPAGIYFGDFENCRAWHKCSGAVEQHGVCEKSLVFDVVTGFCLPYQDNMCQRDHRGMLSQAAGPPAQACTSANQIVPDTNSCSTYYSCQIASQTPDTTYQWIPLNCQHQYFDVESHQCKDRTLASVYPGCDRCEFTASYTSTYWANAVDSKCQKYFICRNGRKVSENLGSCEEDYFFDEAAQSCIEGANRLKQYEILNGACQ